MMSLIGLCLKSIVRVAGWVSSLLQPPTADYVPVWPPGGRTKSLMISIHCGYLFTMTEGKWRKVEDAHWPWSPLLNVDNSHGEFKQWKFQAKSLNRKCVCVNRKDWVDTDTLAFRHWKASNETRLGSFSSSHLGEWVNELLFNGNSTAKGH